jgi:hypothetical protein
VKPELLLMGSTLAWSKKSLPDLSEQRHAGDGSDRQRSTSVRAAAEALFAPKQPVAKPSAAESPSLADPSAHKPRVLSVTPAPSALPKKTEAATRPELLTPAPTIPASQLVRIRAWVKHGMTVRQVAQVTGVAADEIDRILRRG